MKHLFLTVSFLFACTMAWAHAPGEPCNGHHDHGHNHAEELLQQYYDSIYSEMEGDLSEVSVTGRSTLNSKLTPTRVTTIGTAELC
ncbi:MAG: hypothetical protein UHZ06_08030, partial [Paludibacteraceae bacterium]|nr:hypothetical protein [Paludibacteraceae bacterium]